MTSRTHNINPVYLYPSFLWKEKRKLYFVLVTIILGFLLHTTCPNPHWNGKVSFLGFFSPSPFPGEAGNWTQRQSGFWCLPDLNCVALGNIRQARHTARLLSAPNVHPRARGVARWCCACLVRMVESLHCKNKAKQKNKHAVPLQKTAWGRVKQRLTGMGRNTSEHMRLPRWEATGLWPTERTSEPNNQRWRGSSASGPPCPLLRTSVWLLKSVFLVSFSFFLN